MSAPLLELTGIRKSYGGVHALRGADLVLAGPGRVHTLIGENGCGKSSLLGILSGQLQPDAGRLCLDGREVSFRDPHDALRQGIAMVSQEVAVAPHLSVAENVLLGRLPRGRTGVDRKAGERRVADLLADLGLDYDPTWLVGTLRPDQRQMVEVARALSFDARLVVLDEPTSSLTDDEVEGLFAAVRRLRDAGLAFVFVSHRLDEVFALSDDITVLREGRTVASGPATAFDPTSLVDAMVGARDTAASPTAARPPAARPAAPGPAAPGPSLSATARPLLRVRGLSVGARGPARVVSDLDLDVEEGEIVGLAGLVGSGRSDLLEALFGCRTDVEGEWELGGEPYRPTGPQVAIARGVGYLPPDRKTQGLVLCLSVGRNLVLAADSAGTRLRRPSARREEAAFTGARSTIDLRTASRHVPVGTLSGGNQQKVALGKWLVLGPRLLLLDEPTRGVDVCAKAEIHQRLRDVAAGGVGMVISSSEAPELLELCTRIVVLFRGRVVASLSREQATEAALARSAGGHA